LVHALSLVPGPYLPASHLSHIDRPVEGLYFPESQLAHVLASVAALTELYVPDEHWMQNCAEVLPAILL
jgi:hypothetical protein